MTGGATTRLRLLGRAERDDAAALRAAVGLLHHLGVDDVARLLEVVLERPPLHRVREVAHVHRVQGAAVGAAADLAVLADEDVAPLELGLVELGDRALGVALVGEDDDAAALRAAGALLHHVGRDHVAALLEVVLEVLPRDAPVEVADVERAARRAAAAAAAPGEAAAPAAAAEAAAAAPRPPPRPSNMFSL